jgi:predicted MFS family arabinose efflux permease
VPSVPRLLGLAISVGAVARVFDLLCNPFLTDTALVAHPSAVQMIGQPLELVLLLVMPIVLRAVRPSRLLALGPVAWVWVYGCFAFAAGRRQGWPIVAGLPAQGFNCTFVTCVAVMMGDGRRQESAGSAQSLLVAAQAAGNLAGSLLVGLLASSLGAHSWVWIWAAAVLIAVVVSLLGLSIVG